MCYCSCQWPVLFAGKVVSCGELMTALEGAPLDTIYLDAAGQERGECQQVPWHDAVVAQLLPFLQLPV